MTDKEQIINDGVDVGGCEHHRKCILPDNIGCKIDDFLCCDKPNCYFKQLVRKTQECEKYKKRAICFKDVNKQLGYKYLTIKQECEELKKTVDEYKEALEELREECEEHRNNAESYCASYQSSCVVNAKITDIAFKYEQALNEILNIIKDLENTDILTFPDFSTEENYKMIMKQCNSGYVEILDIINKAKDGE